MIALRKTKPLPIGIHWGSRFATLVQLAGEPGRREVYALAHGEIPCNEDAPSAEQDLAAANAIRKLVADHHFKGRDVVSCLGSQELFLQNVRLPQLPREEVEKVVRWEAEERLPYSIDEAEIRHLLAGQVRQDADMKQEVILMACHQGVIQRHIGILELAGLLPEAIDVEPCAVLRSLAPPAATADEVGPQRVAYLNLSEMATTVIFAEAEQVLFLKYIAHGGQHLDRSVAKHLDLTLEEAARMRASVTASAALDTENELHRSVIDAIRGPLDALVAEVELCLRYFKVTFRGKVLEKIVVTGSEASCWLAEFFGRSFRVPCEVGDPFHTILVQPASESARQRPGCWATAMGLAMRES